MNDQLPGSVLDAQLEAMLERVDRDREERCAQIRDTAASQANGIVRSGWTEARANVHKSVEQERSRMAMGLRQAQARAELEARRHVQHEIQSVLQEMWSQITGVLEARWRDPSHRRVWVQTALQQAGVMLGPGSWRIETGDGLPASEREGFTAEAARISQGTVDWGGDATMAAGIRVRAAEVWVDATIPGLLAHRASVESAFLAEYVAVGDVAGAGR